MSDIHVLSQSTINKISAGEVVERPSAVVKELVENAIDAGSSMITVEIKDGGRSLIRVTDNGKGIQKDGVELAFTPHATSKINDEKDLFNVSSLGFRGEALASIDAVSHMEMLTKTRDALVGNRYSAQGGRDKLIEDAGCPEGTTFIVRNLFFNTPARLKFLKKSVTEAGYISDMLEKIALSHPEVSFRFINQSATKLETSGNGDLKDCLFRIMGRDTVNNLIRTDKAQNGIEVTGYIGKPVITRGNKKGMIYFINGRYIQSGIIQKAIMEAYAPFIMQHRFPFCCLQINLDPSLTDVNVHPQKMEIRFANSQEIYEFVYKTIKASLSENELIPDVILDNNNIKNSSVKNGTSKEETANHSKTDMLDYIKNEINNKSAVSVSAADKTDDSKKNFDNNTGIYKTETTLNNAFKSDVRDENDFTAASKIVNELVEEVNKNVLDKTALVTENNKVDTVSVTEKPVTAADTNTKNDFWHIQESSQKPVQQTIFEQKSEFMTEKAVKECRIVGQVFLTYWIAEYENSMYIIDQHAAHEKVMYERLMKKISDGTVMTQQLMPPVIVTLSLSEEQVLNDNLDVFEKLGYDVAEFGDREYALNGVPAGLPQINTQEFFIEVLDTLLGEQNHSTAQSLLSKVASMSCKAAVKGNTYIPQDEAEALLKELLTLDNPYNCPHGRPTMIKLGKSELEKKFKRIV